LLAAVIAVQQNDIKRILAYSTLSQLGYMVMAVGLSSPSQAMFHLTTHAFFKALLFLGAWVIILPCITSKTSGRWASLRKKLPVTSWTFLVGTLSLSALWPFSGFFSKDSILAAALASAKPPAKIRLFPGGSCRRGADGVLHVQACVRRLLRCRQIGGRWNTPTSRR
jgi:NADH-quinone oxidoreductase subunit L